MGKRFKTWIREYEKSDCIIGDLARDIAQDFAFPTKNAYEEIWNYFKSLGVHSNVLSAVNEAWWKYADEFNISYELLNNPDDEEAMMGNDEIDQQYFEFEADKHIKWHTEGYFSDLIFMDMTVEDFSIIYPPVVKNGQWSASGGNRNRHEIYIGVRKKGKDQGKKCLVVATHSSLSYRVMDQPIGWKTL